MKHKKIRKEITTNRMRGVQNLDDTDAEIISMKLQGIVEKH